MSDQRPTSDSMPLEEATISTMWDIAALLATQSVVAPGNAPWSAP